MKRARIVTSIVGTGSSDLDPQRPKLLDDYPSATYMDVVGKPGTEMPSNPNVYVAEVVVDDATLAAIAADPNYGAASILWEQPA